MNILITGATGFVGRHLIPELLENNSVRILTVNRSIEKAIKCLPISDTCTHITIKDREAILNFCPEIVIHLAAKLTSKNDTDVVFDLLSSNITYGVMLLDILKSCKSLRLFLNVGSFAEYRLGPQQIDNAYLYTATKSAYRLFLEYYSDLCKYKFLHIVPYTIYGGQDSQKKIIDLLYDSIYAECPIKMTAGEQVLDFIHIKDVVSFFDYVVRNIDLFSNLPNGEVLHLGTGTGTSIRNLAHLIEKYNHVSCNIDWGSLPYRERDVMHAVAPVGKLIALGWRAKYLLKDSISERKITCNE